MRPFVFILLIILSPVYSAAQTGTYTTLFVPHSVTYNGSDNPNECWESVDWGILVETGKGPRFFTLPAREFEELSLVLKDQEITVEVIYYEERTDDSGSYGNVVKITHKGVVVFSQN